MVFWVCFLNDAEYFLIQTGIFFLLFDFTYLNVRYADGFLAKTMFHISAFYVEVKMFLAFELGYPVSFLPK